MLLLLVDQWRGLASNFLFNDHNPNHFSFSQWTAELCALSEYRIWPGTGKLFIRRDGKPIYLGSSKAQSLTLQRKKPAKLVWTQAWRRLHKKGITETNLKKRRTRSTKVQRAVVGATLEAIKAKRDMNPAARLAERKKAVEAVKEQKKEKASKKAAEKVCPFFI